MASYGKKYFNEFDNVNRPNEGTVTYTVEIWQKFYEGNVYRLPLDGQPVLHGWELDSPIAPIKGSYVKLSYDNNNNEIPLESFYSDDDTTYQLRILRGSQLLFIGFLVWDQNTVSELMVDYKHTVELTFTDGLGLLKNTPLNANNFVTVLMYEKADIEGIAPNILRLRNTNYTPQVQTSFYISGDPALNGLYPIQTVIAGAGYYDLEITGGGISNVSEINDLLIFRLEPIDFTQRNNLMALIICCLKNTGLELDYYVSSSLIENRQYSDNTPLYQTYVDTNMFLDGTEYKSCYEVLEIIAKEFELIIYQSNGVWYIVRWPEYRYNATNMQFAIYDGIYGTRKQLAGLSSLMNLGKDELSIPEFGITKAPVIANKYSKKTFNYNQPDNLLKNYNLLELGSLLRVVETGVGENKKYSYEYSAPHFFPANNPATKPEYFIRVVKDYLQNEIDRYLVLKGGTAFANQMIITTAFEVSEKDNVALQFSVRTNRSQTGPANFVFSLLITNGITFRYARKSPSDWGSGTGWVESWAGGEDFNEWKSININPVKTLPYDGLVFFFFAQLIQDDINTEPNETHYKDIRVTYTPQVNDSLKIIGHVHNNEQPITRRGIDEAILLIDDSPRNSISGTMFLSSFNNLIQNRTSSWRRFQFGEGYEAKRVGEITTFERLMLARIPRYKLEGNAIGMLQGSLDMSMNSLIRTTLFPTKNFLWGKLEIDYKDNSANGTIYEIGDIDEPDSALTSNYTFNYLYDTK